MIDQDAFAVVLPERAAATIKVLMKRHDLSGDDALCMFMSSETYRSLHNPATKYYALTPKQLADLFDSEHHQQPAKKTAIGSDAMRFKVYCVMEYSRIHEMDAKDTIDVFLKYGVLRFLNHRILQWQDLESTVDEIDEFIYYRVNPPMAVV